MQALRALAHGWPDHGAPCRGSAVLAGAGGQKGAAAPARAKAACAVVTSRLSDKDILPASTGEMILLGRRGLILSAFGFGGSSSHEGGGKPPLELVSAGGGSGGNDHGGVGGSDGRGSGGSRGGGSEGSDGDSGDSPQQAPAAPTFARDASSEVHVVMEYGHLWPMWAASVLITAGATWGAARWVQSELVGAKAELKSELAGAKAQLAGEVEHAVEALQGGTTKAAVELSGQLGSVGGSLSSVQAELRSVEVFLLARALLAATAAGTIAAWSRRKR